MVNAPRPRTPGMSTGPTLPSASKWRREEERRPRVENEVARYRRGLYTLDELIGALAGVRLDDEGWTHAAATFPGQTAGAFARMRVELGEE